MFQFGGLELCFGGLSPPTPPHGDGTEQTMDNLSRVSCRSYYFFLQALINECSSFYYRS